MTAEEIVDTFIARVCALDLDGACELVTADCEYDNVPIGKQFGPDGIKGLLGPLLAGIDELDWVIRRQASNGNVVFNERVDRFRKGDTWLDLPVVGVFEVTDDGRIELWRDYFDAPSFMEQFTALMAVDQG